MESKSDKVTDAVETSLKTKLKEHREKVGKDARKQTTLRKLKICYNRGIGAARTSGTRPEVKSEEQWAQARVNSFLWALRNLRFKSGKHDTDLLPKEHPVRKAIDKKKKKADAHREYDDGEPIPSSLPDAYAKAKGKENCANCFYMNEENHCIKWAAQVRKNYWCAAWKEQKEKLAETYNDYPQGATSNAKRALKWKDEHPKNKCGTPVGWKRANQLAKREKISRDTIARMASFKRHQQYKDVPYSEGCGGLMWDAWGGTSGIEWAINKLKKIDKLSYNMDNIKFNVKTLDKSKVDAENGRMIGVSLISVGPALGHNLYVDERSLETIIDKLSGPIPAFITHSGALFEDRLTKEIGIFENFRLDGDRILADFKAFKSFKTDEAREYNRLFELAEEIPDRFGVSIVFSADKAWATSDGDVEFDGDSPPEGALFEYPSIRVEEVNSADFVDQPAANERGLFSSTNYNNTSIKLMSRITKAELIDKLDNVCAENETFAVANEELAKENTVLKSQVSELEEKLASLQAKSLEEDEEKEMEEHDDEVKAEEHDDEVKAEEHDEEKVEADEHYDDEVKAEEHDDEVKAEEEEHKAEEEEHKAEEEEEKMEEDEEEKASAKLSVENELLKQELIKLRGLVEGQDPVLNSTQDDSNWSPRRTKDEAIKSFAKEKGISEFAATLELGRTRPELWK